jgi:hypothetical protein
LKNPSDPKRVGYYDTYPDSEILFRGAWGIYAFLPSGRLLVSDRKHGLFLLGYDGIPNLEDVDAQTGMFPSYIDNGFTYFFANQTEDAEFTLKIFANNGALVDEVDGYGGYLGMDVSTYSNGLYLFKYIEKYTGIVRSGKFIVNNP